MMLQPAAAVAVASLSAVNATPPTRLAARLCPASLHRQHIHRTKAASVLPSVREAQCAHHGARCTNKVPADSRTGQATAKVLPNISIHCSQTKLDSDLSCTSPTSVSYKSALGPHTSRIMHSFQSGMQSRTPLSTGPVNCQAGCAGPPARQPMAITPRLPTRQLSSCVTIAPSSTHCDGVCLIRQCVQGPSGPHVIRRGCLH